MIPRDERKLAAFVRTAAAAIDLPIPVDELPDVVTAASGFAVQAAILMAFDCGPRDANVSSVA